MIRDEIVKIVRTAAEDDAAEISVPEFEALGHYSTNVPLRLAKARGVKPMELAQEIAKKIRQQAPTGFFERIEAAAPGFVNLWLTKNAAQNEFAKIAADADFGTNETMNGKLVMVEFTDVNPFKQVHAGHLMSNAIGESFAWLYEAAGAKIFRVNYQSDVGMHVAMAIWAMMNVLAGEMPKDDVPLPDRMAYLGRAYAAGSRAYRGEDPEHPDAKGDIEAINREVYDRSNEKVNALYSTGRTWSLDYFETLYTRLGTKFVHYFFESEVAAAGLAIVAAHPDIFEKSEGAIVFRGENYGLHTRVFVNSQGLPVYEAKELGLNKIKFDKYNPDLSIIVTGNEIVDYFKVLLKAMELTIPEVAAKTKHVAHGMLRLPTGKMSSRTGDVITAESLIDQAKQKIEERMKDNPDMDAALREKTAEAIAVGALKYSILKQSPGQDIIFDFEKSLSFEGDSGPYVQYAYARLMSILRKAGAGAPPSKVRPLTLQSESEMALIRKMFEFPEIVARARESLASNGLVLYLYQFAALANKFYETTPILKDIDEWRRDARLVLAATSARILKSGLHLLGIEAPEKI